MPKCCICNSAVDAWGEHPHKHQRSEFMRLMQAVGSDLSIYLCPKCGCNDRDRHLWLYLTAIGIIGEIKNLNILHIAPEAHIESLIRNIGPATYVAGDLFPKKHEHVKVDVENIQYPDESFNFILCNHVLEHVSNPIQALREFYRCLVPGGVLLAQTPYIPLLRNTFELNVPVSESFAKVFFGQEDHVRAFGSDIENYFREAGFKGQLLPHGVVLPGIDSNEFGVNINEPLFVFTK